MADNQKPRVIKYLLSIDSHLDKFNWEPFKEGVDIHRIYGTDDKGQAAALLRYSPGAQVPLHVHNGYEHILILSGSQSDGENLYEKGSLMISAPGSQHRIASETGCIVLAIWQASVDFGVSI